jgi:myo-inositol-1(or 4)-monophosphatase
LELLDAAVAAAERAGAFLRTAARPDGPAAWTVKDQRDFVTDADRTSERLIAEVLRERFPASRVVGEELAPEMVRDGLVWIVDPLDGTTNFLHGLPMWAVSIAAAVDGVLEAAVVFDVPHGERWEAARGHGAQRAGERLRVSSIADPQYALVGTGFPFKNVARLAEYQRHFAAVATATSGMRRPGAAAIDLAWVAAGRFDAFWELSLAPWDIAAGVLLVREAGGVVTDLAGDSVVLGHTGLVAGNPAMHAWLLDQVRQR